MIPALLFATVAFLALNALLTIANIGKPCAPITPGQAIAVLVAAALQS